MRMQRKGERPARHWRWRVTSSARKLERIGGGGEGVALRGGDGSGGAGMGGEGRGRGGR